MILQEHYQFLQQRYPELLALEIADLRVGANLLAMKLSDGSIGLASSGPTHHKHGDKKKRDYGDFTPLQITGRTLEALFETPRSTNLLQSLRVAALNAVSNTLNERNNTPILKDVDLTELFRPGAGKKVAIVGAFHSYIDKITGMGHEVRVLEMDETAVLPRHAAFFRPAEEFSSVLPESDIVIMTGLTMVNDTFDDLLSVCPPEAQTVVMGPSSNLLAEVLFQKKVDIIAGSRVTKPDVLFELVSQGGSGYHLFQYCAEKVFILNPDTQ